MNRKRITQKEILAAFPGAKKCRYTNSISAISKNLNICFHYIPRKGVEWAIVHSKNQIKKEKFLNLDGGAKDISLQFPGLRVVGWRYHWLNGKVWRGLTS